MKVMNALGLALALAALPTLSQAQLAYAAGDIHLRAGPAREYPVVVVVPSGVAINVVGCLSDYRWCDVTIGADRGWVYARNIVYPYQGAQVPVINYGAALGIGVVGFAIGNYWNDHYHARPWYPQMSRWSHRPPAGPGFGPGRPHPPGPGFGPGRPHPPGPAAGGPGRPRPPAANDRPGRPRPTERHPGHRSQRP